MKVETTKMAAAVKVYKEVNQAATFIGVSAFVLYGRAVLLSRTTAS